jgi:hypothetical protein
VELGQDVDVAGAVPVVADAEFSQRVASITHHLESAAVN